MTVKAPIPPFDELTPGMRLDLDGKVGIIEELGEARCLGGEGQMPFPAEVGEIYPYMDGSGADGSFSSGWNTIFTAASPSVFIGKALPLGKSQASPSTGYGPEAKVGGIHQELSVVRQTLRRAQGRKHGDGGCPACNAALSLDEAEASVVGQVTGKKPLSPSRWELR